MVKLVSLEIENVKRVQAFSVEFGDDALTVIGGNNGDGKTSILDALAFTLGGGRFKPSAFKKENSSGSAFTKATLSNGIVVERKGKNASLHVTDPSGQKGGQKLLDSFVSQLALDLPRFLDSSDTEKARILLDIMGIEKELAALEAKEQNRYDERLIIGRDADRKKKYAEELTTYEDVPNIPVTASELIQAQQAVLLQNAKNRDARINIKQIEYDLALDNNEIKKLEKDIQTLQAELKQKKVNFDSKEINLKTAKATPVSEDEDTAELEKRIEEIETTNAKVRANLDHEKAVEISEQLTKEYNAKTVEIETVRDQRLELLSSANLPLPGLSIRDRKLIYNNQEWDCMSGSERLIVATSIVQALSPECSFVLIDKLEQMDLQSIEKFKKWLEKEKLQVIGTRVGQDEACTIIIENGLKKEKIVEKIIKPVTKPVTKAVTWGGSF